MASKAAGRASEAVGRDSGGRAERKMKKELSESPFVMEPYGAAALKENQTERQIARSY